MEIECPSGLVIEVRKLKGSEANILADRKAAQKGETFDKILNAITTGVVHPGPYAITGDVVPWKTVLLADRYVALVGTRIATYGPDYVFPAVCGDDNPGKGCGHKFEWGINLAEDLPLYPVPEESRAKIAAGQNRFEARVGGRTFAFHLQTGNDERAAMKRVPETREEMVTASIASRIIEIEGVGKYQIDAFLKDLDLDVQQDLLAAMEEVDGGFETQIEIECPKCERRTEMELPFGERAFWLPGGRSRGKGRKGRSAGTMAKPIRTTEETPAAEDSEE